MKCANLKAICLAFLILNFPLFANGQSELPPKPTETRAAIIPTPVEKTLSNGLRVIVVERKNVPLVTASLMIKSGGEIDPQNLAGAADMTAELLTKGTKTRSATQIAEQIEFLGGSIESNAAWDFSSVTWRVMSDKMDKATEIAADTIKNPVFAAEEVDRYKTQTLDELSVSLKQPGTLANYVANKVVFKDGSYGHPLGGTPESLTKIKRDDLVKIHATYYKPNNSILIIAGDIAPSVAFALAQKHFGDWTVTTVSKQLQSNDAKIAAKKQFDKVGVSEITVVDLPDAGQAAVVVATKGIDRGNTAYFQGLVANSVLGGGYSARLNQEIRIRRGLSYGAGSALSSRRTGGIFLTRAQTKNESAAEVAEIVINELNRLAIESINDTELTPRKTVLTGGFARDLETTGGLVNQIGQLALYDLPLSQINSYIQNVQNIKDESTRNFVKDLFANGVNVVIVGDASKFAPDLQKRFPAIKIETIPASRLDLNGATLRTAK